MNTTWSFSAAPTELTGDPFGLSSAALEGIFFGPRASAERAPRLLNAPEPVARAHKSDWSALTWMRAALENGVLAVPDPKQTGAFAAQLESRVPTERGRLPFDQVPVFHRVRFGGELDAWLCSFHPTGRITQLIVPEYRWCGYYGSRSTAEAIVDAWQSIAPDRHAETSGRRIGLVELIQNFGHQALNSASGLEDLLQSGIQEVIVLGQPDFLGLHSLFPQGYLRVLDRWDMHHHSGPGDIIIKSGGLEPSERIIDAIEAETLSRRVPDLDGRPLLAVTVRHVSRRCTNLPEVVAHVVDRLRKEHPRLGVIIDGWVLPEAEPVEGSGRFAVPADAAAAKEIEDALGPGLVVESVVGRQFLESVAVVSKAHACLAHIGTLQHKYGLFTNAQTVVHGPTDQLNQLEPGAFLGPRRPNLDFLRPEQVRDLAVSIEGGRRNDYEIVDFEGVADRVARAMSSGLSGGPRR